jgi:hypothetical protein
MSDSFILLFVHFYFCFALIPFFYSVFTIILDGALRLRVWISRKYSLLNIIHSIIGYYSFIFNLPKISAFAYFIPKGTERDQTRFSAYFSLCFACKIKKYRTSTQKLFGTHSHPVTSLTSIESCLPFYFSLYRKYFYVLKTPKVEQVPLILLEFSPNSPNLPDDTCIVSKFASFS